MVALEGCRGSIEHDSQTRRSFLIRNRQSGGLPSPAAAVCAHSLDWRSKSSPQRRSTCIFFRRHLVILLWTVADHAVSLFAASTASSRASGGSKLTFQLSRSPPCGASFHRDLLGDLWRSREASLLSPDVLFSSSPSSPLLSSKSIQGVALKSRRPGRPGVRSSNKHPNKQGRLLGLRVRRESRKSASGTPGSSSAALAGRRLPNVTRKQGSDSSLFLTAGRELRRWMTEHTRTLRRVRLLNAVSCENAGRRSHSASTRVCVSTPLCWLGRSRYAPFTKVYSSYKASSSSVSSSGGPSSSLPTRAAYANTPAALSRVVKGRVSPAGEVPIHIRRPPYGILDSKLADAKRAAAENEDLRLRRVCEKEMRQRLEPFLPVTEREMEWVKPAKEIEGERTKNLLQHVVELSVSTRKPVFCLGMQRLTEALLLTKDRSQEVKAE